MSLSLLIKTGGSQIASRQVIESPFHSSSQNRKISTAVVAVSAEKATSVPETDSSAQGKSFDTFHPFLRLPAEIKAMILEEAIEYDPAIVYGHCELDKKNHELIKILHGTEGKDSKVKYIRQLVDVLPEFQTFVEAKFGKPFSAIKRWPSLAVRLDKDLMVFIFKRRKNCYFDWYSKKQRLINHSQLAPGIRNVGIRFNADCSGMECICSYTDPLHNVLCPLELSMFCESLSHLQNLFVLVKLDVGHMLKGPLKTKVGVKSFIERRLKEAKCNSNRAIFEDKERTWVEVKFTDVSGILECSVRHLFRLLERAFRFYRQRGSTNANGFSRQDVRFRVLVSSKYKK